MSHRVARISLAVVLASTLALWGPTDAQADDSEQVTELVKAGIEDFQAERFLEAVSHFLEAKAIYDDPNLDWNIARGFEEAGDCANAVVWFERVENRKPEGDDKKKIKKLAKESKKKIKDLAKDCPESGTAAISCIDDKARISGDGGPEFACPITLQLSSGDHSVTGRLESGEKSSRTVLIAAGSTTVVEFPSLLD